MKAATHLTAFPPRKFYMLSYPVGCTLFNENIEQNAEYNHIGQKTLEQPYLRTLEKIDLHDTVS